MSTKKWEIQKKFKVKSSPARNASASVAGGKLKVEDLIDLLLENRGIKGRKEREEFLHPKLENVTIDSVGINKTNLKKALKRIDNAIREKEQIIIFGDYDVDGITGSAILWETLHDLDANVLPYIPHRIEEGYGLSVKGIENLRSHLPGVKLIITVDNGIVANEAVEFANAKGIDVIITDHHMPHTDAKHILPNACAVVHTTLLCGAGVAYLLSRELLSVVSSQLSAAGQSVNQFSVTKERNTDKQNYRKLKTENRELITDTHLELAALGTIADMVPLTGANRAIVYHGLKKLQKTKRLGLLALFDDAGLDPEDGVSPYQVGHLIAPRLNAAGRLETAMDSLRLLCTHDRNRASTLARQLGRINKERQNLMTSSSMHAIERLRTSQTVAKRILIIAHENYQEGVIGLIAGRIVEEFYKPAIVISKREKHSKASVRSVHGFNIIEFLRSHSEHFVNVGGHPMAAGFTIETTKIRKFTQVLEESAEKLITDEMLQRSVKVDCEIDLAFVSEELYRALQRLEPFGVGNPEPMFLSKGVTVDDVRVIGKEGKHLKLKVSKDNRQFDVIAFGMGERSGEVSIGDRIDIVYSVDENVWNGNKSLQLKLKDFKRI